ncbi:CBS domain-containing protein [Paraburkholderia kururiensis]|uniref:CBS domain-containing protein n=1 Tax=Paraburkholderia kururiensis TaxID=984307 RepID=A0ABZ0WQM5_9BURK|nr:CBS domain-containing protein [Paraburkholderia kururiensis]WQD79688.1 CBS domain-containing protein [Paraburkholderia kururiensis]
MNAATICTRDVVTCRQDTTVLEAARLMRNHHVGDLVVVEESASGRMPLGVITDRDIVLSVVAKEVDPAKLFVSEMMSTPVVSAYEWEDEWQLLRRMRLHGIRRMPVLGDADELIGIVAFDDLLEAASGFLSELWLLTGRQSHFEEKHRT